MVRGCGETWAVDPEMREAFDRLGADLRGEVEALRAERCGEMQTSVADVVGKSLRGDIRSVAEFMALSA